MFGIGTLFYAILFFINGIAILSEDRFLSRIGWTAGTDSTNNNLNSAGQFGYGDFGMQNGGNTSNGESIKSRIINLISATRTLLRIPLIIVNIIVILYELVLG
ncbi:Yos1 protein [Pichia kluyveri]|uniref:Yos1 protein n=1 Tax=Pichia kluyveri TaxID=36015 RepID=A0AAV5R923_PICKL|nr:Yos1 protein [Pichia kluyveri]